MSASTDVAVGEGVVTVGVVMLVLYILYKAGAGITNSFSLMFQGINKAFSSLTLPSLTSPTSAGTQQAADFIRNVEATSGVASGNLSPENFIKILGSSYSPNSEIPGTGLTIYQLRQSGYTDDQIDTIITEAYIQS